MEHILVADHVSKRIKGKKLLCDISLKLFGGQIYGFVGENGSGKTMLFRVLSGLVKPTAGMVKMDHVNIYRDKRKVRIGVIIETAALWPDLTGLDNLSCLAAINKVIDRKEIIRTMVRVGLDPENDLPIRKYSLGMKQRLLVAQAVMEQPEFLFLDEPTNAIDEDGAELTRQIIQEEAGRGAVVLLASHISRDVSALCTDTYRMERGRGTKEGSQD